MLADTSKRKFLQFGPRWQHKNCAAILRALYEKDDDALRARYTTYLSWMGLSLEFAWGSHKEIADQYHRHLKASGQSVKEHRLLPHIRKGDHTPKRPFLPVAIYLDQLRSAYNVGSILRTMEALRIGELHTSELTPFTDNEKVQHTSMGAFEWVKSFQNTPLEKLPRPFIALETSDDAVPVHDFLFPETFTLILGNEEYGISDRLLQEADVLIEVPLFGAKNSINVACAFSIAAAEIARQSNFL